MTEAVAALVAYCFDELAAHRIEALIHPDNAASIRLVGAPGLSLRGRTRCATAGASAGATLSVMMYAHCPAGPDATAERALCRRYYDE